MLDAARKQQTTPSLQRYPLVPHMSFQLAFYHVVQLILSVMPMCRSALGSWLKDDLGHGIRIPGLLTAKKIMTLNVS